MPELFRNSSPGALTLEQAREMEIQRERARRAQRLAQAGVQPVAQDATQMEEVVTTGRPSTIPLHVEPHQRAFFDALDGPVTRMSKRYDLNPENVLGLMAYEGHWFDDPPAIQANNPFGTNTPGTDQLHQFESLDHAFDYWGKVYGDQLRGTYRIDDFINGLRNLRAGPYNSKNPKYDPELSEVIQSVNVKRPLWQQER